MKYINKNIAKEPASLRNYRNSTPNARYDGGNFDTAELRNALLLEQGYICAYCMSRIDSDLNEQHKPKTEIEHINPRATFPKQQLDYQNMVAVCNGLSVSHPEKTKTHHCDKTKGSEGKMNGTTVLKRLIPTNITCETLITYDSNGSILAKNGNIDVNYDLNTVLNLNNEVLKKNRRIVIDLVKEQLNKEKPHQKWTKELFDKHKERWLQRANDKYRQFCMIAVWFLDNLRMKPQYL